jgi:hypothetical protein
MPEKNPSESQVVLYQTKDGRTRVEVQFRGETAWLSLNQMAELFQRDKSVISKHVKHVFDERELEPAATVAEFATVHAGKISHEEALRKAEVEFEKYRTLQLKRPSQVEKDFEDAVKKLPTSKSGKKK